MKSWSLLISVKSLSSPTCQRVVKQLAVDGSSTSKVAVVRRLD